MLGKMSLGVSRIVMAPRTRTSSDITTNVYGRRNASLTIHMVGKALPSNNLLSSQQLAEKKGDYTVAGSTARKRRTPSWRVRMGSRSFWIRACPRAPST